MKKIYLSLFGILTVFCLSTMSSAQESSYSFYGNVRFAHIGIDTKPDGIGGPNTVMRLRPGIKYFFNETHSFSARLVYLVSKDFEPLKFTIRADGNRALAYGSLSFDEFYYRYSNNDLELKLGRFQKSISVFSNAKRSHLRFQSNANFVHWSDGLYAKKNLNDIWFAETVLEYQNRGNVTFPYRNNLTFGNSDHNITSYFGIENQTRDKHNIIQKGIGVLFIPNAYLKTAGYSSYFAITSRIAFDFPQKELLKGGSFRIVGEIGQNLNTAFDQGSSLVTSFGIHNFANRHEIMFEFAKTDRQWLTATPYAPNADELEIRYRFFITKKLNADIRYRVREPRSDFIEKQYSTFFRVTYSF